MAELRFHRKGVWYDFHLRARRRGIPRFIFVLETNARAHDERELRTTQSLRRVLLLAREHLHHGIEHLLDLVDLVGLLPTRQEKGSTTRRGRQKTSMNKTDAVAYFLCMNLEQLID